MGRDPLDEIGDDLPLEECANEWQVEAPRMSKMTKKKLTKWAWGDPKNASRGTIASQIAKSIDRRRVKVTLPKIDPDE